MELLLLCIIMTSSSFVGALPQVFRVKSPNLNILPPVREPIGSPVKVSSTPSPKIATPKAPLRIALPITSRPVMAKYVELSFAASEDAPSYTVGKQDEPAGAYLPPKKAENESKEPVPGSYLPPKNVPEKEEEEESKENKKDTEPAPGYLPPKNESTKTTPQTTESSMSSAVTYPMEIKAKSTTTTAPVTYPMDSETEVSTSSEESTSNPMDAKNSTKAMITETPAVTSRMDTKETESGADAMANMSTEASTVSSSETMTSSEATPTALMTVAMSTTSQATPVTYPMETSTVTSSTVSSYYLPPTAATSSKAEQMKGTTPKEEAEVDNEIDAGSYLPPKETEAALDISDPDPSRAYLPPKGLSTTYLEMMRKKTFAPDNLLPPPDPRFPAPSVQALPPAYYLPPKTLPADVGPSDDAAYYGPRTGRSSATRTNFPSLNYNNFEGFNLLRGSLGSNISPARVSAYQYSVQQGDGTMAPCAMPTKAGISQIHRSIYSTLWL